MSELRKHKIESAIFREISTYIHSLDDKYLSGITITHVEVSDDLRYAKIFYTSLGHEEEQEEIKKKLSRVTRRVQRDIAHRLKRMKFVPLIAFYFDLSLQKGNKVLNILDQLEEEIKRSESNG